MSQAAYAERRGVSKMTVSLAIKHGRLVRSVVRNERGWPQISDPVLADQEWDANTDPTPRGGTAIVADGTDYNTVKARHELAKAELAELKLQQERGELVPASEVAATHRDRCSRLRTKLLGIPSRARQSLPHLTIADIGALEELIRESLQELVPT